MVIIHLDQHAIKKARVIELGRENFCQHRPMQLDSRFYNSDLEASDPA